MRKFIYFIRHGESEANANNVCCGQGNPPLTEKGKEQAKAARVLVKDVAFDTVFCSDLQRAKQTAEIMLDNPTCHYTAEVREILTGHIEGKKRAELNALYPEAYARARTVHDFSEFGGESDVAFVERAQRFLDKLAAEEVGERVAVVCHAGFIQRAVQLVMGCPYGEVKLHIENCSVTILRHYKGKWTLYALNRSPEMP